MFNRNSRFLGIDIGNSAIKLIELNRRGGQIAVDAIAIEPLPEGAIQDGYPVDPERISAAIERAAITAGTRLKQAAVAVPTASIITRAIAVPANLEEREIEAHIRREASELISFSLEEAYLDFQIQGISENDDENQEITIVASRKENVDWRRKALEDAGLMAVIVDVEAYALENLCHLLTTPPTRPNASLPQAEVNRLAAMIDMGSVTTTLYVFQDHRLIFSREQAFGCEQLTLSIIAAYGLSRSDAEVAKCSGELPEDYGDTILEPFKQSTAEQIDRLLRYFSSANPYAEIGTITLIGGGAMITRLDRAVTEMTGITTTIGNPYPIHDTVEGHGAGHRAPLFAVAWGLALRSFD